MNKPIVQSYGGGTQSIVIWLLIEKGVLPMPDLIVMVDTGREATRTWKYNAEYIFPRMLAKGANFHIAPHSLAHVDQYAANGDLLIPAYTQNGKLPGFCSSKWKVDVFNRYVKILYGKDFECVTWLGMSTDEIERMKPSGLKWKEHHWPLCDMPVSAGYGVRMNRMECQQLLASSGLPPSIKSACYDCPHTSNNEWQKMQIEEPGDFAEAVKTDYFIRANDNHTNLQEKGLYLHKSRKPLDMIDFSQPDEETLFGCADGFCWT